MAKTNTIIPILSIVIGILISTCGLIFGTVNNSYKAELEIERKRTDKLEVIVYELQRQSSVIDNELKHLNRKLDEIMKEIKK